MKNALKLLMLVAIFAALATSNALAAACHDDRPPDSASVDRAIVANIGKVKKIVSYKAGDMTCRESRKGESVWTVQYDATILLTDETARVMKRDSDTFKGNFQLVQENSRWFFLQ